MIRYNSILIALTCIACIAQQFIPSIGLLYDIRILIVPIVFLSSALTGGVAMMLGLAFVAGFLWDCQHTLATHPGDESIYIEKVETIRFGYTIILYAIMGAFTIGVTPLFRAGKWYIPTLAIGFSLYFYLWSEFFLINIVRGDFAVTNDIFMKISFTTIASTIFVPLLLLMNEKFANLCNHMIKNDNRRRFFPPDRI